jgi:hypothetical protein
MLPDIAEHGPFRAMSRGLLNSVTVRMISSWPSLVMQTLVAGS